MFNLRLVGAPSGENMTHIVSQNLKSKLEHGAEGNGDSIVYTVPALQAC